MPLFRTHTNLTGLEEEGTRRALSLQSPVKLNGWIRLHASTRLINVTNSGGRATLPIPAARWDSLFSKVRKYQHAARASQNSID